MNRYRYTDKEGKTPPPDSPSTGWVHTDAVVQRACPKCGVSAGFHCETPKGHMAWSPHKERIKPAPEHQARRTSWD